MRLRKRKGFTLIELIVVIVILGLLVAILVPSVSNAKNRAQEVARDMAEKKLYEAAVLFTIDFPNTTAIWNSHDGGKEARKDIEITQSNLHEAWFLYMDEFPKDPTRKNGTFTVEIKADGEILVYPRY